MSAHDQSGGGFAAGNPAQQTAEFDALVRQAQQMFAEVLKSLGSPAGGSDPLNAQPALGSAAQQLWLDPARLMQANLDLWQRHVQLWQRAAATFPGSAGGGTGQADKADRRFRHPDWEQNPFFDFIRQSYLITSGWLVETMAGAAGLDPKTARKVEFYTRLFADAFSPSNFVWTNPEVLRATLESGGQNLVRGLENFRRDLDKGQGRLQMTMSDPEAFVIGRNIATTPGKVIFQNELIQLIQYRPLTAEVWRRPLVIFPPWINKYYILDLSPEKSLIRWAVERGYTVFVVSWVNPDSRLAEKSFDDYLVEGIIAALDAVEAATGEREVSALGYCIGGTLLAVALAWLAARGDERIRAATFLAAQVDFSEPGDLGVFVDEQQLANLERMMADKGYLDAEAMFTTFNMLRANDLIWSFYIHNYLLGRDPVPMDLLHWNADATRMPRRMHLYYLREMYLHNSLVRPGALEIAGMPIDLTRVSVPVYLLASREDHIAPWASVFKAKHNFSGPVRFVLAGSGHIAGVINPPARSRYQYWSNEREPAEAHDWLGGASEHPGSWWPDWDAWLAARSGDRVPAREPGGGALPALEDAPGSYVCGPAD